MVQAKFGSFRSPHPWSPERPETLVIVCSDGRYHPHLEDFLKGEVSEKPDLIALPGGPAAVDPWASSFDHARVFEESMGLLLARHDLRSVWLIAHEGCSFYRKKHGDRAPEELRLRQVQDLKSARERIAERWPRLQVRLVYARAEAGRVEFLEDALIDGLTPPRPSFPELSSRSASSPGP